MILVYDEAGKHAEICNTLMIPTGVEYKVVSNFTESILEKEKPTSVMIYVDQDIKKPVENLLLREMREYLLILLMERDIEINERIRYSSEIVFLDILDLNESRKRLRKALSSHTVRKLKTINNFTIYLAKNGIYPGTVFYTKPENTQAFMSLLLSVNISKKNILIASRFNFALEMPEVFNDENFVWVTDSIGAQRNRPVNLSFISDTILKRMLEGKSNVVFVDIFDLLIVYHDFFEVARAFEQIKSAAIEKNSYLILVFSENAMDSIQFGQITRFCQEWQPQTIEDLEFRG
ncbi:DUF835 domain-containing protein [Oxyplasma meridianum]|uniref:DUF835 domain-containing protein n=1 Tax=Oxyplasma meridianum TaxID=3073602 RepID=A0AAX4NHL0_9ARCH